MKTVPASVRTAAAFLAISVNGLFYTLEKQLFQQVKDRAIRDHSSAHLPERKFSLKYVSIQAHDLIHFAQ